MFAIIANGGKQYRVATGDKVVVDRMDVEVGASINIDQVLLGSGDDSKVGTPNVDGAKVVVKVLDHHKGEKVITFKYRPTRRMRKRKGYRHSHTTLEVVSIDA